ncbi:hypothetical protein Nepgr_016589 [Nepenthes gracilis]|uniref:Ternary complex factor MIP1, leucine-zipper n=1 Tax=Nepenthes gracilis TaxID=150966 RepID=A0AAD3SN00_NEPGR|nr:hypothetical protein Nepgr_016589 [Nepenthes gracilis]
MDCTGIIRVALFVVMGQGDYGDTKLFGLNVAPRHKRSKSFPDKMRVEKGSFDDSYEASPRLKLDMGLLKGCSKCIKKQSQNAETHNSLKQEISLLEKRLQDEVVVRGALEKALGCGSSYITNEPSIPKPAAELIKEIAVLELEVVYLEQYLLSLYRKAFDQQISSVSPTAKGQGTKYSVMTPRRLFVDDDAVDTTTKTRNSAFYSDSRLLSNVWKEPSSVGLEDKMLDSGVHRCHSSLSQHSPYGGRTSTLMDSASRALLSCHSQPLSMMEYAQSASSNVISLAEHLGTRIADHVPDSPNRISEDMVKCMAGIFCKLADPPSTHNGLSSPNSSSSSVGGFSPLCQHDVWSPGFSKDLLDAHLDNPFNVEGLKEFSGPYSTMVEVPCIYRECQKSGVIERMLENFRSLICRLQEIDPKKMKYEEKLAFWINVHNALVMHAFLAYGIPQNNVKRVFLLLKAAYNVGGHTISADTIQSTILGCRMSRPGQWFRRLMSPRSKFKTGDERQAYAIERQEPLLHFALCSGSHSDPALRVYTPKRVFQELEAAKEEYIRATFGIRKDHKILLPKVVGSYAKDAGLCQADIIRMVQHSLPESLRKKTLKKCQLGKRSKSCEWMPHDFSFRYLITKELVRVIISSEIIDEHNWDYAWKTKDLSKRKTLSKDTLVSLNVRVAEVDVVVDDISECLDILDSRVEEHENAKGLTSMFQRTLASTIAVVKSLMKFQYDTKKYKLNRDTSNKGRGDKSHYKGGKPPTYKYDVNEKDKGRFNIENE